MGGDTFEKGNSLPIAGEKTLYGRSGFPQLVQGKPGENYGESASSSKSLSFS
jgi:hypothetical protein